MSAFVLPTKLKKEPLVEALFEIRFSSSVPASSVLPGLLFSQLSISAGKPTRIERLPVSDIPSQMRSANPVLMFQPLLKLYTDRFVVMVGDASVIVACELPYPGWVPFKRKIIEIINILKGTKIIESVVRYSVKYVDIIDGNNIAEQINRIDIELKIGNHKLISEPFTVRVEIKRDELTHLVQIATPSSTTIALTGATRTGILLDIDTVCDHKTGDLDKFTQELPDRLESIHAQNKAMFFECLTRETIDYLEPVYDPISAA